VSAQDFFIGKDVTVIGTGSLYVSGNFEVNTTSIYTNDGTVEIKGNITNNKVSMPEGTGLTTLSGSSAQTIAGAETFTVHNITINNSTAGSNDITLSKDLIIGSSATFTNGIIVTGSNNVIFKNAATTVGSSDISHVTGKVKKIGNQAFTFPIGDASKYRPASIAAPSVNTDAFTAIFSHSAPTAGIIGAGLNHISFVEKWNITQNTGSSNPLVTLSYETPYSGGITSLADLRVANLVSGTWTNLGGSGVGTLSAGTVTASSIAGTWDEFTLASSSTGNPLPITLVSFDAFYNHLNKGVDVLWVTASEKDCEYFSVEHSINAFDWEEIHHLMAGVNTNSITKYKCNHPNPSLGINYYRLKEHDINGHCFYSGIKSVKINTNESGFLVFPNPFKDNTSINFWQDFEQELQLDISNIEGQTLISTTIKFKEGDNIIPLNLEQFASGVYYITIHSLDASSSKTIKVLKQD